MAIHHELDLNGRANFQGQNAESLFVELAKKQGFKVTPANSHQERIEHWDFLLTKEKNLKVEVKSLKTFAVLHNGRMTKDFLLIEWKTVTGHGGWIYGKADLIAFERQDGFYLIPRKTLLDLAEKLCAEIWVDKRENMLYRQYQRKERKDIVSAILLSDVIATRNFSFWKK
jgi:hypothetical protein